MKHDSHGKLSRLLLDRIDTETLKGNKLFISNWLMAYLKRFVMIILVAALQQKVLVIFAFDLHK